VKKTYSILSGVVIFSLIGGFFGTQGTALVRKKSVEELTYEADSILIGKVTSMESRWNGSKTLIHTYVTVFVRGYIKRFLEMGEPGEVTIKVPGGQVGDIALRVSDTPEFREGEEVFLFLKIEELPIFRVAGLLQGKYTVWEGRIRNRVLEREIPLESFIDQIQKIIEEAKGSQ